MASLVDTDPRRARHHCPRSGPIGYWASGGTRPTTVGAGPAPAGGRARRRHEPDRHRRRLRPRLGRHRLRRGRGAARSRAGRRARVCATGWCWRPRAASSRPCRTTRRPPRCGPPARRRCGGSASTSSTSTRSTGPTCSRTRPTSPRRSRRCATRARSARSASPTTRRPRSRRCGPPAVPDRQQPARVLGPAPRPAARRHARRLHAHRRTVLAWSPLAGGRLATGGGVRPSCWPCSIGWPSAESVDRARRRGLRPGPPVGAGRHHRHPASRADHRVARRAARSASIGPTSTPSSKPAKEFRCHDHTSRARSCRGVARSRCPRSRCPRAGNGARRRGRRGAAVRRRVRRRRFRASSPTASCARSTTTRASGCPPPSCCARAVRAGLTAAERSDGLVDPTLVGEIEAAGYVASRAGMPGAPLGDALAEAPPRRPREPQPGGRAGGDFEVDDEAGAITRPPGVRFDTGGTGKGLAADLVAAAACAATRASSSTAAATSGSAAPTPCSSPTRSSSSTR